LLLAEAKLATSIPAFFLSFPSTVWRFWLISSSEAIIRSHDAHSKFHEDFYRRWRNIDFISVISKDVILVLLMGGIYKVRLEMDSTRTSFHEDRFRHLSNITDGRDFLITSLRWSHVPWYVYQGIQQLIGGIHVYMHIHTAYRKVMSKACFYFSKNYSFAFCWVWVWNLVSWIKERDRTKGVREQGPEFNIFNLLCH
jgi:hypothetical protein